MIEPTPKLLNILYACANGRLPWGPEWTTEIPLCEGDPDPIKNDQTEYILCCGHTLRYPGESSAVVGAGLMLPGKPDKFGRPTLTITKAGRAYLEQHRNMVQFDG